MDQQLANTPTITVTPAGVVTGGAVGPARVALSDFQSLDRTLSTYNASGNSLINASAELLSVCGTLARQSPQGDMSSKRLELARIIIELKYKVVRLDYPPSVAENLCLLYAIVLDEFILSRDWGEDSGWENRTLVADLFGFRDGGDRFYTIADRALMQPKVLREFLEIVYIFLKLGYRGKYNRSNGYERDRLIDLLETALGLVQSDTDIIRAEPVGRAPRISPPPARIMRLGYKLALAAASLALISGVVFAHYTHRYQFLSREFQTLRADAENQSVVDFVFSSQTGNLEEVPRQ